MPAAKQPGGAKKGLPPAMRKAVKAERKKYTKAVGPVAGRTAARATKQVMRGLKRDDASMVAHGQMTMQRLAGRAARQAKKGK